MALRCIEMRRKDLQQITYFSSWKIVREIIVIISKIRARGPEHVI